MKSSLAFAAALLLLSVAGGQQYRVALPGYRYEFPRDHFSHPDFQTEWWYYTGNLRAAGGQRFGFELTFFRHGVDRNPVATVRDVQDAWFAHLALSAAAISHRAAAQFGRGGPMANAKHRS